MEKPESQNNSNNVRATGVIRIVLSQTRSLQRDDSVACIERTCSGCGTTVNLTLNQASLIPPDQTDCAECFLNLIQEGFEVLERRGIIFSTISQDPVD